MLLNANIHYAKSSMRCAGWSEAARRGACCPTTSLPGTPPIKQTQRWFKAGYDGAKRRKGSKVHAAVDTLGHLLALHVTPVNEQDRDQVAQLAQGIQEATGLNVEVAYVDQSYTGEVAQEQAHDHCMELVVVNTRKQRKALSCCLGAGWWNAASPGQHAFGDWHATMNAWPKLWQGFTSLRSFASCLVKRLLSSTLVHNRL